MTHTKRRDYAFNLFRNLMQSFLVFSPFIHALSKAYVEEMELSCDAAVIRDRRGDGREYGSLLLNLASLLVLRDHQQFFRRTLVRVRNEGFVLHYKHSKLDYRCQKV